jgi:hypothetical protein
MSAHAVASLQAFCSQATAERRLSGFFAELFKSRVAPVMETPEA